MGLPQNPANPPTTVQVPWANPDAAIVPSPDHLSQPMAGGAHAPAPAPQPPAQPEPAPAPAAAQAPIVVGDRTFTSLQEATAFLDGQMRIVAQMQPATPAVAVQEVDPADLLFEDPKTAVKLIKQSVKQEIDEAQHQANEAKRIETEFYSKHEDLMAHKSFVQFTTQQLMRKVPNFDKLPQDKVFELVAAEARAELAKVRGMTANGQPLPDRPAVVAGGGGAAVPVAPAAPPAKPTSFVEELSAARARRAK